MNTGLPDISIVVIGRNEGQRLIRCLHSVRAVDYPADKIELIYVDTDSTDGSNVAAEGLGANVIVIRPERPTAAAARNAGFSAASHALVQFLDGDTTLDPAWLTKAVTALDDPGVACVFGRVEEVAQTASVYNFWAHHDWYVRPGLAEACGGIAMFRRDVLTQVGGFDDSLIAGEERDLCFRVKRMTDLAILCLDEPMVLHDMDMARFSQYWRRCRRTGHACAEIAYRHPEAHRQRIAQRRNMAHASAGPAAFALSMILASIWPLVIWAGLLTVAVLRNALRLRGRIGTFRSAVVYSCHHYLSKTPEALGQCAFWLRLLFRRRPRPLIEHRD